jgi:PAS domain S-box-containing protein
VLLVEDSDGFVSLIRAWLDTAAIPVHLTHAERLADALARLACETFDVVLLDLALPDSDGLATLGRLREQAAELPVVVLTGIDDEALGMSLVQAGAQDYLVKGQVTRALVVRALRYAVERHRAEEQVRALNAELEARVAARMVELEATVGALHAQIAERQRAEAAIRFQAQLLDEVEQAVVAVDNEARVTYWNRHAEQLYGWTAAEALGRRGLTIAKEARAATAQVQAAIRAKKSWSGERLAVRRDGTTIPVSVTASPLFGPDGALVGAVGVTADISERRRAEARVRDLNAELERRVAERTRQLEVAIETLRTEIRERERAEEALRASEERYRELFENANDIVYTRDMAGSFTSINRAGERILGYPRAELLRMNVSQVVAPEYHEMVRDLMERKFAGDEDIGPYELEVITKGGARVPLEVNTRLVRENGRPVGVQGIARDITDRRRAEEALRASEERFRLLTEHARDVIFRYDFQPIPHSGYMSPSALTVTGYSPEEFYADPELGVKTVHPDDRHLLGEPGLPPEMYERPYTVRMFRKDGTLWWGEYRTVAIRGADGKLVAIEGIIRDVTERNQVAGQLAAQAQELALLEDRERIAMDLHDGVIQSLYAVTLGLGAQALQEEREATRAALDRALAQINGVIQAIRNYIFDLRVPDAEQQGLRRGLNLLVTELRVNSLVEPEVELDAVEQLLSAEAEASLLQIIHDATTNVMRHASASAVAIHLTRDGDQLVLTVRDNGRGFDPQRAGRRAGDGLRNMAERSRRLGGRLTVSSQLGQGTTVRLELPLARIGRQR